jgi:hypothetical protein
MFWKIGNPTNDTILDTNENKLSLVTLALVVEITAELLLPWIWHDKTSVVVKSGHVFICCQSAQLVTSRCQIDTRGMDRQSVHRDEPDDHHAPRMHDCAACHLTLSD